MGNILAFFVISSVTLLLWDVFAVFLVAEKRNLGDEEKLVRQENPPLLEKQLPSCISKKNFTWLSISSCIHTSAGGRSCKTVGSCTLAYTPPCTLCGTPGIVIVVIV